MRFLDTNRGRETKFAALVYSAPTVRIYHGKADGWPGAEMINLVFTNPYGPLPNSLLASPMVVHQWTHRRDELSAWIGDPPMVRIGEWNYGREAFWVANQRRIPVEISEFHPEPGGWYPPELVRRILSAYDYGVRPFTVWDGFMGRGTIGKVALEMGMSYVGVEELPAHVDLALDYLGLAVA